MKTFDEVIDMETFYRVSTWSSVKMMRGADVNLILSVSITNRSILGRIELQELLALAPTSRIYLTTDGTDKFHVNFEIKQFFPSKTKVVREVDL